MSSVAQAPLSSSGSWRYSPGQNISGYRLVRPLGRGGASEVFEAIQERIGQRVAIKLLRSDTQSPAEIARLLNEARILAQLQHPGIVAIHACGELPSGDVFLVMEYVEGASLRSHLRRLGRPLPLPQALSIGLQIAEAMNYVHLQSIVHREAYVISIVCFHLGHFGPQRRRNKPCSLTVPAAARSALTSH